MRVLVACEESQAVTIEFRKLGHEAYSCDVLPCSGGYPEWHIPGKRGALWNWGLPQSKDRARIRSKTFPGIARATANQWG